MIIGKPLSKHDSDLLLYATQYRTIVGVLKYLTHKTRDKLYYERIMPILSLSYQRSLDCSQTLTLLSQKNITLWYAFIQIKHYEPHGTH